MDYYKKYIKFEKAPEPEDIIFENLERSQSKRFCYIILESIVSLIFCGISWFLYIILYILQRNIDREKEQSKKIILLYSISFGITIITSATDLLLEVVIEKIIKWEMPYTWTNYYTSYSIKLTFFSFLNSAVVPIICELIIGKSE